MINDRKPDSGTLHQLERIDRFFISYLPNAEELYHFLPRLLAASKGDVRQQAQHVPLRVDVGLLCKTKSTAVHGIYTDKKLP